MTTPDSSAPGSSAPDSFAPDSVARAQARSAELEVAIARTPKRFRVLTGDRPTGPLHLGHLFGTLANRVRLQQTGVDVLVLIADYQVITDRDHLGDLPSAVTGLVLDQLAAGLDPDTTTFFRHSAVPALNQLMLPFLSLVSVAELQRNPTVKAEGDAAASRPMSGLLLTYPVHQAADILSCGGNLVPVGRDQLPHLELTRTIARRFDQRYGPVFTEPDALLGQAPLLLGTDGTKMSKSRGNAIALRDDEDRTAILLRRATTDAERRITFEPARRPSVANVVLLGALCAGQDPHVFADGIGDRGAAALKAAVTEAVNEHLRPLRRRRAELAADPGLVPRVLARGNARANELADATLDRVRTAMGMR
jgi:tryptophanyl-tRNA synthetase